MVAATKQKSNKKKKQKRHSKHNEQLQHYTRYHYTLYSAIIAKRIRVHVYKDAGDLTVQPATVNKFVLKIPL